MLKNLLDIRILLVVLVFLSWNFCLSQSAIGIAKSDSSWQLLKEGKPYTIKGVTFGFVDEVADYDLQRRYIVGIGP